MIQDGTGKRTHYCSRDEGSIDADADADADAGVYSTAALALAGGEVVADEGLLLMCLVS
jgi:hypothetical protein